MPYLYTPPQYKMVQMVEGALRYKISTSTSVYRIGGVWINALTPSQDIVGECDVDPSGLVLFFATPTVVPDTLHDALAAVQPANSAWTAGTLTPA